MKLSTTLESTTPFNPEYETLSPGFQNLINSRLDELQRLKAGIDNQHDARTENLESLIEFYYREYQTELESKSVHLSARTQKLYKHMLSAKKRKDIAKVPSLVVIRRVVYRLAPEDK